VIPYSQKKENTRLRVYGLNIKNVHLQVFNDRSEKVYEGEGDAENTYWDVTGADGKVAPEGTYSYKATVTVLDEQGEEHIVNKQNWVQVIW
ncbi:MAG: gliding motility-associated C-terminal domain-containing protein, partial [Bacteroidales bacterium]|nr:gliding motility-associated C-terminal domain-containing protein [Bacteroidales bacterium]